jgi:hypothetical protein
MVCAERTIGSEKSCWTQPMEFLSDMDHVKSHFSLFGDSVLVLVQDRCTVYTKCTIDL